MGWAKETNQMKIICYAFGGISYLRFWSIWSVVTPEWFLNLYEIWILQKAELMLPSGRLELIFCPPGTTFSICLKQVIKKKKDYMFCLQFSWCSALLYVTCTSQLSDVVRHLRNFFFPSCVDPNRAKEETNVHQSSSSIFFLVSKSLKPFITAIFSF